MRNHLGERVLRTWNAWKREMTRLGATRLSGRKSEMAEALTDSGQSVGSWDCHDAEMGLGEGTVSTRFDDKGVKRNPATRNEIEPEDEMYVEYISQIRGEPVFKVGGKRYQYVNARYRDGRKDIGVYSFSGDMVLGYNYFQEILANTRGQVKSHRFS